MKDRFSPTSIIGVIGKIVRNIALHPPPCILVGEPLLCNPFRTVIF